MPRQGLTYEEYAKAADEFHLNGLHPSISRTLAKIGYGSRDTHSKYQKVWLENQKTQKAAFIDAHDEIDLSLARIGQQLRVENDLKITEIKTASAAAVEAAVRQQLAAEEQLANVNQTLEMITRQLKDTAATKEILQLDINSLRHERDIGIEREKARDEKIELLQGETASKIKILEVQMDKIINQYESRLEEQKALQALSMEKLTAQQEEFRHLLITEIDSLKTELKNKESELTRLNPIELAWKKEQEENARLNVDLTNLRLTYTDLVKKAENQNQQFKLVEKQLQQNFEEIKLTNKDRLNTHEKFDELSGFIKQCFNDYSKTLTDLKLQRKFLTKAE